MYEILAVVLMNLATVAVLAWRLNGIDPDLTMPQYVRRIAAGQFRLGSVLFGAERAKALTRKPDGRSMHPAFARSVAIAAGSGLFFLVVAAAVSMRRHGL